MIDIDLIVRKPISEKELIAILSKPIYRSDFINEYPFFRTDGHTKIYQDFIDKTDFRKNNERLDDAIVLADSIDYYSIHLLNLIKEILFSKKNFVIKLTCLDYLLSQHEKIDNSTYIILNNRYKNNSNEFLNLQANINLLLTENKSEKSILKVLNSAPYPNIFYRFFNSISFNTSSFKNHINIQLIYDVLKVFESRNFSEGNWNDIKRMSKMVINDLRK